MVGGYVAGVFTDEGFYFNVRTQTLERAPSLPSEAFPFAMPTVSDTVNSLVYTVDWNTYKVMRF